MTRRFTSEIINEIGPEKDIPAPDVGTDASVMAWIFDTYSMNKGHSVLGVVTGKPLTIGGSLGREEATARGALYCIREAVQKRSERLDGDVASRCRASATSAPTSRSSSPRTARRWSRSPTRAAAPQPERHRRRRRRSRTSSETGSLAGLRGGGGDHERGAAAARRATCSRRARSSR